MLKRIVAFVITLSVVGDFALCEDRRTDRSVLVIMTLNAEFMWDGEQPEDGRVDFPWKGSKTEAEEHMSEIAKIIIQNDPDILNLVEIENFAALAKLNNKFLPGRGYSPYFVQGKDTFTGEDMGLLTRIDPEGGEIQRDDREGTAGGVSKSVSKNYYAKFDVGGQKIGLIGIHLLAHPNDSRRRAPREAQADAVRQRALDLVADGYQPIIVGDFNDYDGDPEDLDHIDSTPITNVLSNIKGMDPADPGDDLLSAAQFIPKAERYTAFWDKDDDHNVDFPQELASIDHMLLDKRFASLLTYAEAPHNYDPRLVTDHFPIVARFEFAASGTPTPPHAAASSVRLVELLPNPEGDESENEQATLKNIGTASVDLTGWKLRDLVGRTWSLDGVGSLNAGASKAIKRAGQSMAMNNRGDTIDLVDAAGRVVQTVTYGRATEGEPIQFAQ